MGGKEGGGGGGEGGREDVDLKSTPRKFNPRKGPEIQIHKVPISMSYGDIAMDHEYFVRFDTTQMARNWKGFKQW